MKCPNCGRENPDIRLFCMQCGELLPETETEAVPQPAEAPTAEAAPETQAHTESVAADSDESDDTQFYRTRQRARGIIEEAWPEDNAQQEAPAAVGSIFDEPYEAPESEGNLYSRPSAPEEASRRPELSRHAPVSGRANTHIPKREETMGPDDFFAVRGQVLPEYDDEDEIRELRKKGRKDEYEEEARQSFAVRHMRGIVTLMLLALTVAIVLIWANTDSAQYTLAKADLAWKSDAYVRLAEEAYAIKDLSAAGYYYTAALKRDEANINYAIMAANSYIEGGYTTKALAALRTCIEMEPTNADLYAALIQLQPEPSAMSASDLELIRKGYEITGDSRLNIE